LLDPLSARATSATMRSLLAWRDAGVVHAALTKGGGDMASRKYSKKSGRKVKKAMHEMKRGKLKSGRSGKKVKSRKQAIAIGLSQARRSGAKVPKKKSSAKSRKKKGASKKRKASSRKKSGKK
jgi:hypothetical protein